MQASITSTTLLFYLNFVGADSPKSASAYCLRLPNAIRQPALYPSMALHLSGDASALNRTRWMMLCRRSWLTTEMMLPFSHVRTAEILLVLLDDGGVLDPYFKAAAEL